MIISFFNTSEFTTGVDQKYNPDCIYQEDREINLDTQVPVLMKDKGGYSIEIHDKTPPPESPEEKRSRVKRAFLEATDEDFSTDLLEGEIFEGKEFGDLLNQKLCGGNIYKEMQFHRELLDIFLPFLMETFGDKLSSKQKETIQEIQGLGTRVKTLLSHF